MTRLKRGVTLFASTNPDEYFCGTLKRTIRISTAEDKRQIHLLSGPDFSQAEPEPHLLAQLAELQLIDTSESALTLTQRHDIDGARHDAAFTQLRTRVGAELAQSSWIDGVRDTGVTIVNSRQNFLIEISGANRVATLLYSLLLASGVTQTRYSAATQPLARINNLDIALSGFLPRDIGAPLIKEQEKRRQDFSLFPIDKDSNYLDELSTPDLIIHCGEVDPEKYARWMTLGQPFLYLPAPIADCAEIGPLVIPGKTPCIRCAQLWFQENTGTVVTPFLASPSTASYPIVAAHYIAAIAASHALAFCDSRTLGSDCEVTGKVTICDYQSLSTPQEITIARHPLCGCSFNDR